MTSKSKTKLQTPVAEEPTSALSTTASSAPATATVATAIPAAIPMTTVVDFAAIPMVSAPPTVTVPSVPPGYSPAPGVDLQGYRPIASEVAAAPDAILEITSFPNWALVFGMTAPPASQVAQRLQVAAQWSALLAASEDWYNYVKSQTGQAWKSGLEVMSNLKAPFQLASAVTPAMPAAFPALARLLSAQQTVGLRAAATRKRNAAAALAAPATTTATGTTPASTASTGTAVVAVAPATSIAPSTVAPALSAAPVVNVTS